MKGRYNKSYCRGWLR